MKNKRVFYLDFLKVMSILFVIYNHTHMYVNPANNFFIFLRLFLFSICKIAVPIFIMVSGALLLGKKTDYKEIFTKRIFRVFVAYLIACVCFCLYNNKNPLKLIFYIWDGSNYNYIPYWGWYIYMLIGLYLVLPFLQKLVKSFKEKDYKMFILLFLVIASAIEFIPSFSEALIYGIFHGNITYKLSFNSFLRTVIFSTVIGYFIFGYYISNKKITKKENMISIITFIIVNLVSAGYLYYCFSVTKNYNDFLLEFSYFPVAIASMCMFVMAKYYFSEKEDDNAITKFISLSGGSVFGIYLFHVPLIGIIHDLPFMNKIFTINSFLGTFIDVFAVFIILDILFFLIRKIPLFRKIF